MRGYKSSVVRSKVAELSIIVVTHAAKATESGGLRSSAPFFQLRTQTLVPTNEGEQSEMCGTKCERRLEAVEPCIHNCKSKSGARDDWPGFAGCAHVRQGEYLSAGIRGTTTETKKMHPPSQPIWLT